MRVRRQSDVSDHATQRRALRFIRGVAVRLRGLARERLRGRLVRTHLARGGDVGVVWIEVDQVGVGDAGVGGAANAGLLGVQGAMLLESILGTHVCRISDKLRDPNPGNGCCTFRNQLITCLIGGDLKSPDLCEPSCGAAPKAAPALSDTSGRYRTARDFGSDNLGAIPHS